MTLYEIDSRIQNCVDMETGEVIDLEALTALEMARDEKIENVACWVKDEAAMEKSLRKEAANLTRRAQACDRRVTGLKKWLNGALDGRKFETAKARVSYRSSTSVDVYDDAALPEEYVKIETRPDKAAISEAIKSGKEVPGARLSANTNVIVR